MAACLGVGLSSIILHIKWAYFSSEDVVVMVVGCQKIVLLFWLKNKLCLYHVLVAISSDNCFPVEFLWPPTKHPCQKSGRIPWLGTSSIWNTHKNSNHFQLAETMADRTFLVQLKQRKYLFMSVDNTSRIAKSINSMFITWFNNNEDYDREDNLDKHIFEFVIRPTGQL